MIEHVTVPEQIQLGVGAGGIALVLRQFAFERRPEALHGRVVVAAPRPAHTHRHPSVRDQGLVALARVLSALVGMVPGARPCPAPRKRGMEGGNYEVGGLGRRGCPANHLTPPKVEHAGDVAITFIGRHRRDIAHPPRIRRRDIELAVQHIGGHLVPAWSDSPRSSASVPRPLRLEVAQAHQPPDMIPAERCPRDGQARCRKGCVGTTGSIWT